MRQLLTAATGAIALPLLMACGGVTEASMAQETHAHDAHPIRTMSISATGEASAAPDMANLSFAVETTERDVGAALSANAERMSAVFDFLKKQGIAESDLQTTGISLNANNRRDNNGRYTDEIESYTVRNSINVRLRDMEKVSTVIDGTVGAGANRMNNIWFSFSDTDSLMDDARRDAIRNAKAKATLYAEEAGVTLGDILSISEGSAARPPIARGQVMMAAESARSAPTPVAAGENTVSAQISIVFEID